jgi:hypothetical protein
MLVDIKYQTEAEAITDNSPPLDTPLLPPLARY